MITDTSTVHDQNILNEDRIIYLMGSIDEGAASQFIKNIDVIRNEPPTRNGPKDVTIKLKTQGGDVVEGLAIFDAIRALSNSGIEVTIHVVGPCWSMGALILQAGDRRIIEKHASIMLHKGSVETPEDHPYNAEAWAGETKKLDKILTNMLLERIRKVKRRFSAKKLEEMILFDKYLTPTEALEYNLVDWIIE